MFKSKIIKWLVVVAGMATSFAIAPAAYALSTDATLSSLATWSTSSGTLSALSPAFGSNIYSYTESGNALTTSITVQPATTQANATIQVRINGGSWTSVASWASLTLALNTGSNPIDVKVTAQDGTTTLTYTITVTRAAPLSTDATLSSLVLSAGTLSPAFASGTISYTASTAASSITMTPTVNQANATVQVKVNSGAYAAVASGSASGSLALNLGAYNYVYVLVTAQDGTTTLTYTITVTRLSTDATLQSLTLPYPAGTLSPTFASGTYSYTDSVPSTTTSTTVTPATTQANATIQVRVNSGTWSSVASWSASGSLALNTGSNPIDVKVTAQDGTTTLTYTITVTRGPVAPTGVTAAPGNASASVSWTASGGATSYTVTSSPGSLTCTAGSSPCTVSGLTNGTAYTFTVTATNVGGTSSASTASSAVTPVTVSGAPTSVSVVAGNGSASVSWTAPASIGGSVITGYTVTSSPGSLTCTAGSSPCTVSGLTNGTAYTFTVTATNGVGNSVASAASTSVTTSAPKVSVPVLPTPAVLLPPVASIEVPVTKTAKSNEETRVEASINVGGTSNLVVDLTVPSGDVAQNVTVSIAPAITSTEAVAGSLIIKITATDSSGAPVTHFDKPLVLDLGSVRAKGSPMFSEDGIEWVPIQKLSGTTLPEGVQEGYYIASDGTVVILTHHLTYFGMKKYQRALGIVSRSMTLDARKYTTVTASGGSGKGIKGFSSFTPALCSITKNGLLKAISVGVCAIQATKSGDDTYLATSSSPLNIVISKIPQRTLLVVASEMVLKVGESSTLITYGGSGSGVTTFTVSTSTTCSVSDDGVATTISPGICTVVVVKEGDALYLEGPSTTITLAIKNK